MALITDPDSLNDGVEIIINTSTLKIQLVIAGNLSTDGVTLQAVYSKLKELWKTNNTYIMFPFPLLAITEEKYEIQNGWDWNDTTTKQLIRTGGWALKNNSGVTVEEYAGIITLGSIDVGGQVYYTQYSSATSGTNFILSGAVNQAIQIYSSGTYDYKSYLNLNIREQGKIYDTANLSDIGVSTMTYQVYRFPLTNGSDIKITHSDGSMSASPYSAMSIQWYTSAVPVTIGTSARNFHVIINGNNGTAEQIYEFVQYKLRSSADIDSGSGTKYGKITNELLNFVGDTLYTLSDTTGGVYISAFQNADTNRIVFVDDLGVQRTYPYVAVLTLQFGSNLTNDTSAIYRVFFTNDDAGDNTGRDFGTSAAIVVNNASDIPMSASVGGSTSVQITYNYDSNNQRGTASIGTDAPITVVGIGLNTAQYVNATGTITRSTSNTVSLISPLERNYSNP